MIDKLKWCSTSQSNRRGNFVPADGGSSMCQHCVLQYPPPWYSACQ